MKKTGLAKDVSSKSLKELLDISGSLTLLGSTVVNATPKALIEGSCAILRGLSNPNGIFNEGSNVRFGTVKSTHTLRICSFPRPCTRPMKSPVGVARIKDDANVGVFKRAAEEMS